MVRTGAVVIGLSLLSGVVVSTAVVTTVVSTAMASEPTFWTDAEPFVSAMRERLGTAIERKSCNRFGGGHSQVCRFESAERYGGLPRYGFDLGIGDDGRLISIKTTYRGVVTTADVEPMRPFGALMGHVAELVGMDERQAGEFGRYVGAGWTGNYLPPMPAGLDVHVWRTESSISVSLRRRGS